jgi:hypothetical protein
MNLWNLKAGERGEGKGRSAQKERSRVDPHAAKAKT